MSKSQEGFNKKEKEKLKQKKKQDKEQKKLERKTNSDKGKNLEQMLAYVDANGNISSTPVDPKEKPLIQTENIQIGVARQTAAPAADVIRKGTVTFFNTSKGYGFIKDHQTQESIFVHVNELINPVKENDKVSFETEMGKKGLNAVRVKLIV
ncbi:cold shock domain-containing protein [Rhodocytophaga rosea]|uniref:Cold shock domain-containing protein n=1 Tax=Rhodocytophaga rosea TaxID=2704465 RepID=A0A6C0GF86_9BACT|nr:cold shock domain-containing protein [Rhodocytophaga rosea]QHT66689.1 cold shock domain-containing protein [Rhodocytophaga rosea]